MGQLEEKVSRLLQHRFGRWAKVEIDGNADGIIGTVISPKFRGVEIRDRVDMVRDTLDASLNAEERLQVVLVVSRTPEEVRED
jgi:acid stress-induced BolA-like protein IbaG/YrbA